MAKGIAAADDLEKNAKDKAGSIFLKAAIGEILCCFNIKGRLIKAWIRLAVSTITK